MDCLEWSDWVNTGAVTVMPAPYQGGIVPHTGGDFASVDDMRQASGCENPVDIECRVASDGTPASQSGQNVTCNTWSGFICYNNQQVDGLCYDYEVRVACLKDIPECRKYISPPLVIKVAVTLWSLRGRPLNI